MNQQSIWGMRGECWTYQSLEVTSWLYLGTCVCVIHCISFLNDSLLLDGVGHEDLEEVVGDLIKIWDLMDALSNNPLLILEHSHLSVQLHIASLFVIKALECFWDHILIFMIEEYTEGASVIIDLKVCSCWLLIHWDYSTGYYNILQHNTIKFKDIIWSRLTALDHIHCHWYKHSHLPPLSIIGRTLLLLTSTCKESSSLEIIVWVLYKWPNWDDVHFRLERWWFMSDAKFTRHSPPLCEWIWN